MSILSRNDDYFKKLYGNVSRNTRDELDRMSGVSEDTIKHKNNLEDIELSDSDYDDYFGSMFKSAKSELGLDNKTSNNALGDSLFDNYETKKQDGRIDRQIARNRANGLLEPKNASSNSNNTTNTEEEKKPFYKKIPVASDTVGGLIGGVAGAGRTYAEWDYKYDMRKAERYKNLANNQNLTEERRQYYQDKYEKEVAQAEYWRENNIQTAEKMLDYANSFSTIKEDDNMLVKAVKGAFGSLGNIATATIAGGGNGIIGMGVSTYGQSLKEAKEMNLSEEDTHKYALSTAFIESGSELVLPGAKGIKTFLTTGSIKQAVKEAGVGSTKEFIKQVGVEFGQESATEVANIINERRFEDKDGNPIATSDWRELGERIMVAGLSGAIMGGVTEGAGRINKAKNNQAQNSVLSQQEDTNIKPETAENTVNQTNITAENANKAKFLTPQAQKLNDAFGFDVSNLIEENINENAKTANSTSEIANNAIPEINNNPDTIFKGKSIDAEGNSVYVKEDGTTINSKLFDLFAESNNIDVNKITRLSEAEMQNIAQNESVEALIETIEDSVMEEGAEATVKSLNESLNSGAIDTATYDTAVNLVNEINTELNTATQQESVQDNTTQHDSTQNNAETLSNKAKTIENAVNTTNIAQVEATQSNTTQQEAVNVGSTQHKATQNNTKTGILVPNGITAEQLDKAYKQDPKLKSRMEEASKARQNAEAKLKEVQKQVKKQADTVNKIDEKVNKSKTVKEQEKAIRQSEYDSYVKELKAKQQGDIKKKGKINKKLWDSLTESEKLIYNENSKRIDSLMSSIDVYPFQKQKDSLKAYVKMVVPSDTLMVDTKNNTVSKVAENTKNTSSETELSKLKADFKKHNDNLTALNEEAKKTGDYSKINEYVEKHNPTALLDKMSEIQEDQAEAEKYWAEEANKEYLDKVEKLNKVVNGKDFKTVFTNLKLEVIEKLTVKQDAVNQLGKAIGREVIFFNANSKNAPAGFMKNNIIFLNGGYGGSAMAQVLGHETFHTLKTTNKETFNKLVEYGKENFTAEEITQFLSKIDNEAEVNKLKNNPDLLSEEMLAEAFGNDFANKEFWKGIEKKNKSLFEKIKDIIAKIFNRAKSYKTDFLTQKHIDELRVEFEGIFGDLTNNSLYGEFASNDIAESLQDTYKEEAKASKKKTEAKNDIENAKVKETKAEGKKKSLKEWFSEDIETLKNKAVEEVEVEVKNKTSNELFKDNELVDIYKAFKRLIVPFEYSEHTGYGTANFLREDSPKELKNFVNSLKTKFDVKNVKTKSNWIDYEATANINGKDMIFRASQAPSKNKLELDVVFKEKVTSGVYKYSNYKNDIADVKSLVDMIEAQTSKKVLAPKKQLSKELADFETAKKEFIRAEKEGNYDDDYFKAEDNFKEALYSVESSKEYKQMIKGIEAITNTTFGRINKDNVNDIAKLLPNTDYVKGTLKDITNVLDMRAELGDIGSLDTNPDLTLIDKINNYIKDNNLAKRAENALNNINNANLQDIKNIFKDTYRDVMVERLSEKVDVFHKSQLNVFNENTFKSMADDVFNLISNIYDVELKDITTDGKNDKSFRYNLKDKNGITGYISFTYKGDNSYIGGVVKNNGKNKRALIQNGSDIKTVVSKLDNLLSNDDVKFSTREKQTNFNIDIDNIIYEANNIISSYKKRLKRKADLTKIKAVEDLNNKISSLKSEFEKAKNEIKNIKAPFLEKREAKNKIAVDFEERTNLTSMVEEVKSITNALQGEIDAHIEKMKALAPKKAVKEEKVNMFIAPNHNESITNTKSFKDWFRNSKVVDKNGDPVIVYHGTPNATFNTFKSKSVEDTLTQARNNALGFFFTESYDAAKYFKDFNGTKNKKSGIYETYLSLQNPKIYESTNLSDAYDQLDLDLQSIDNAFDDNGALLFKEQFIKEGYDGIILKGTETDSSNGKPINQYIAFYPNQIKSATNNNGNFDPNNDDIRFSTRRGKEFDNWFKGSVMVKENGKPQLFYHTTDAVFDDFNDNIEAKNGRKYGAGHYFTDKRPQPGYGYGKNRFSVNLKIENPLDFSKNIDIDKAKNIARDLDKEFGATKYGEYRTEKLEKTIKSFGENGEIPVSFFSGAIQIENSDYRDILREYGYDGIIEYSGGEHYVVAFSNDQVNIKSRVDEDGVKFSTRSKEETAKITAPLQKVAEKTNNLQLRAGIHKLQGVKVDKNVDLVGIFNNAIDSMASNAESAKANIKTLKNALMEEGISSKEANAIAKYFTNIIDVAKETYAETTPVSKNVITSSSYKGKSKGIKAKTGEAFDSFYTHIVDTNHAAKMVNDVFYNKAKTTKNSFGVVDNIFTESLTDKNGNVVDKSLKEMFDNVFKADDITEFMDYALHKHNISRALQGKYVFFKEDGSPMKSTDSAKIVKQYEAKHPDFASRQEELTGWINTFMETWAVDTGLMSKDFHSMLKEMYNHYVPTNRSFADHEELFGGGYGGKGFVDKSKPTKRAEKGGSARDIIDLQESVVNLVAKTVRTAKMNEVGQELVKAIQSNAAMKGIAEIVDKPNINVDNVVRVLVEGEPVFVEVHNKQLLEMLEQVHTPEFHAVIEASKKSLNVVKQLITSKNPLFAITNTFRDYQTYMINSIEANVFKRWGSIGKALKAVKNNTKEYQLYKAMGISSSGIMAKNNTKTVQNITGLKSIIDKDTGALLGKKDITNSKDLQSRFTRGWNKFNEAIETLTGTSETTFRLAEFINSLDRGLTLDEATVNAMEITVDFSRSGDYTRFADAGVMYLNAGVQGLDKVARQVKKHPIQSLTRSMVHIAAPAILLSAINGGDDDYEMLDSRTKDNNFLIPLWLFGGEEGKFLKLPKAREYGAVAMLCERLIYGKGEEGSFDNLWRSIKENMAPADVFADNIISDINKAKDNEARDFAGRYIVPKALQDKEAKDQWDDDTTVLAKHLGQLLNFSPKKIDYYLDHYTGIVGDLLMPLLTPSTYASSDNKDAVSNILAPITKKFVADNAYSSSATSKYYDNLDELKNIIDKEQEGLTTAEKRALTTETEAFKSAVNEVYGNDISDLNEMLKDNSLSNSEKRRVRKARNEAMKQANEAIKKFLSPKNK